MVRLEPTEIGVLRHLFDVPIARLISESLISGHTKGTAWADDPLNARLAVIHSGSCVFVSGDPDRLTAADQLVGLLLPSAGDRRFLKLFCLPDDGRWDGTEVLPTRFEIDVSRRIYCEIDITTQGVVGLPTGFSLRQIDQTLLSGGRENLAALKDEILGGWMSEVAFLDNGFGFAVVSESAVLSWCTGEYLSPGRIGIGIETVENCQGQGFATVVAAEFVRHALRLGLSPHWDCWTSNLASVRVAEKVGFRCPHNYVVTTGSFVGEK